MFSFKASAHVPGKIMRFGKAYHGLIEFVAVKSATTTQLVGNYSDIMLTTRAGLRVQAVSPRANKGAQFSMQIGAVFSPVCAYMHPLAVFLEEEEDGKDWSGYAIYPLDQNTEIPDGFNGLTVGSLSPNFAFTPSDNAQGRLVRALSSGYFYIYPGIRVGERLVLDSPIVAAIPEFADGATLFHADMTGRSYYLGRFSSAKNIVNDMYFSSWDSIKPVVICAELTSNGSGDDITISAYQTAITQPDEEKTIEYSEVRKAQHVAPRGALSVGLCAGPPEPEVYVEVIDGPHNPPFGARWPTAMVEIDMHLLERNKACVMASIVSGVPQYTYLSYTDERSQVGSGTVGGTISQSYGEPCGPGEEGKVVTGNAYSLSANDQNTYIQKYIAELTGFGQTSTLRVVSTSDYTYSRVSTRVSDESGQFNTDNEDENYIATTTVTLDGQTIYTGSVDITVFDWDVYPLSLATGSLPGSIIFSYGFAPKGERKEGDKWLQVVAKTENYHSADMVALSVYIITGTFKDLGDGAWGTVAGSQEATLHIGKIFSRGFVDSSTHSQALTGDPVYLYRAYDPIEGKVSDIYPHPVIYQ